MRFRDFLEPLADMIDLELLEGALDALLAGVGRDVEPVEQHVQEPPQNLHGSIDRGRTSSHKQPNAVFAEHLSVLEGNVVVSSSFCV